MNEIGRLLPLPNLTALEVRLAFVAGFLLAVGVMLAVAGIVFLTRKNGGAALTALGLLLGLVMWWTNQFHLPAVPVQPAPKVEPVKPKHPLRPWRGDAKEDAKGAEGD